ncbi:dimethylamine monooxygenase subunit DmmA family protein [Bacillus sp. REN10]|uniref:dimethylamine monooxygenase subunit DmmA family protein n=1 Tax=Bacillus sp. REN10 TaxID=2782541 RepID=UPI00193B4FF1|nr:dimethylamine monooxygenase subunit DmmA family protein [Bacillus sp. REN10]
MYNSPVLYDQSETIKETLTLNEKRNKHLIIYDQQVVSDIKQVSAKGTEETSEYEYFEIKEGIDLQGLRTLLYGQKMGTHLYIASNWDHAVTVFTEAVEAGFTEDEIQTIIYGPKKRYIYCMKCYETSEISYDDEVQCSHCDAHMEVGPFFSKVRKGYIGYPFIPNEQN